jgi:glutathione synthase
MSLRIGVVMDPVEEVDIRADTTFAWMMAATARGHELVYIEPTGLEARGDQAWYHGRSIQVRALVGDHYTLGEREHAPMSRLDLCWMRKDPPFNDEYLYSTYVLELADASGQCFVLNRPRGLRDANEKAYILHFPAHIPETLVTHNEGAIKAFVTAHGGRAVIKPLDGHGGAEVFLLREDDLNLNAIIETITRVGRRYVMVQEFLPEAAEGDKRILVVDGEPYGAILRVPKSGELRGNIHVGGRVMQSEITPGERAIIADVAPRLQRDGLYFVGLDVIGGRMTELNVTSPTGIVEMTALDGVDYSDRWIAWQEEELSRRARVSAGTPGG